MQQALIRVLCPVCDGARSGYERWLSFRFAIIRSRKTLCVGPDKLATTDPDPIVFAVDCA